MRFLNPSINNVGTHPNCFLDHPLPYLEKSSVILLAFRWKVLILLLVFL